MFLKAFFVCILFIFSTLSLRAQPDAFSVIMPGEKKVSLSIFIVNGREYFSLKEIGQKVFPGSVLISQGTEISFKNTLLRTAPSGFFVIYETPEEGVTAQMNLPALKIGREIYVPAPAFLEVFETLGVYRIAQSSPRKIVFKKYEKPAVQAVGTFTATKELPEEEKEDVVVNVSAGPMTRPGKTILQQSVDEFKPKLAPVLKNLESGWPAAENPVQTTPENTFKIGSAKADSVQLPQAITPNHYVLPRDLRRRALERTKDGSFKNDGVAFKNRPLYASLSPVAEADRTAITKIEVIDEKNSTEIIFTASSAIEEYQKPELSKNTVVFRIPNSLLLFKTDKLFKKHPLVNSFKAVQIRTFSVFTLTLDDQAGRATARRISANKVVLEIFKNDGEAAENDDNTANEKKEKKAKDRWKLDVIVLDPGHGGEDHGATSISGFKEKDITLEIALKVEKLLKKKLPYTKVVMTRRDDRFIELFRRGQIANESGGKLFISIHCNSMPKKPHPAHGFETYILRPGRNDDAVRVADRENAAVKFEGEQKRYKKLTDEQLIIATMAQSAFVKFSEHFAELLQREVSKTTPLHSRGVNQAGFYVLVGASMPNVLFETAFLSNEDDEDFLTTEKGKQKMAEGIAKAVERYAAEYEELLKER